MKSMNLMVSRKKLLFIILTGLLLSALVFAWFVVKDDDTDQDQQTSPNSETPTSSSKDNPTSDSSTGLPPSSGTVDPQTVPKSDKVSLSIFSLTQTNHIVSIDAVAEGTQTQGTCVFSLNSEGARPVIKQVVSVGDGDPQTCSVKIPEVEFEKVGSWNLSVAFYYENTKAETNQNVTIN